MTLAACGEKGAGPASGKETFPSLKMTAGCGICCCNGSEFCIKVSLAVALAAKYVAEVADCEWLACVIVEGRSELCDFLQQQIIAMMMISIMRTPPTAPPMIIPVLVALLEEDRSPAEKGIFIRKFPVLTYSVTRIN